MVTHTQMIYAYDILVSLAMAAVTAWLCRERFAPLAGIYTATGIAGLAGGHLEFSLAHPDADYFGVQMPLQMLGIVAALMAVRSFWPRYGWVVDTSALALGPHIAGARMLCFRTGCCVEVRAWYVLLGLVFAVYSLNWWKRREGDGKYGVRCVLVYFLFTAALEYHFARDPILVPSALVGALFAALFVR